MTFEHAGVDVALDYCAVPGIRCVAPPVCGDPKRPVAKVRSLRFSVGTETYGKFVENPYPNAAWQKRLGHALPQFR